MENENSCSSISDEKIIDLLKYSDENINKKFSLDDSDSENEMDTLKFRNVGSENNVSQINMEEIEESANWYDRMEKSTQNIDEHSNINNDDVKTFSTQNSAGQSISFEISLFQLDQWKRDIEKIDLQKDLNNDNDNN